MSYLFWLALAIGGGLLLVSLFSDATETDVEHEAHGGDWGQILSLRTATYFMFAFGATGVLLQNLWSGRQSFLTAIIALVTGLVASLLSSAAFTYLRRTDVGQMHGDKWLIGRTGEVTLPLRSGSTGKISVTRAGQTQELLAMPLNSEASDPESWREVMVVEMRDGIAMVAPSPESTDEELSTEQ
jgi:hypothetical protein